MEKIITDNSEEIIKVRWDGTRFVLISERKNNDTGQSITLIILNPREMQDIIKFAQEVR